MAMLQLHPLSVLFPICPSPNSTGLSVSILSHLWLCLSQRHIVHAVQVVCQQAALHPNLYCPGPSFDVSSLMCKIGMNSRNFSSLKHKDEPKLGIQVAYKVSRGISHSHPVYVLSQDRLNWPLEMMTVGIQTTRLAKIFTFLGDQTQVR